MIGNTKIHPSEHPKIIILSKTKSDKEIALDYGVVPDTIYKIRKKYNCLKQRPFKYEKDHSYFDNLDKPEKYYMLGLMYSDGFLVHGSSIGLCLHPTDEDVLDFFKSELNYLGETKVVLKKPNSFLKRVDIHSKRLYDALINLGLSENKSLKIKWPVELESSPYIWNFILGVFDGDGSISISSKKPVLTITGTQHFCEGLIKFLSKKEINCRLTSYKNTTVKTVSIVCRSARLLCDMIINSQSFSMKRKRELINYISYCYNFLTLNGKVCNYAIKKESFEYYKKHGPEKLKEMLDEMAKEFKLKSIKNFKLRWKKSE